MQYVRHAYRLQFRHLTTPMLTAHGSVLCTDFNKWSKQDMVAQKDGSKQHTVVNDRPRSFLPRSDYQRVQSIGKSKSRVRSARRILGGRVGVACWMKQFRAFDSFHKYKVLAALIRWAASERLYFLWRNFGQRLRLEFAVQNALGGDDSSESHLSTLDVSVVKPTTIYDCQIYDVALNNFARLSMSAALASPITK
jgi:hypothetical protein